MKERNLDIARTAYSSYAVGDVEATGRMFAPDAIIRGPRAGDGFEQVDWTERGGFLAFVAQIAENWRLTSYDLMRLEAEGAFVTAFLRITASHWKSGGRFDGIVVDVLRFRDGLCVEYSEFVDPEAMRKAAAG
jgi:ketosteroid isomerase-like protein